MNEQRKKLIMRWLEVNPGCNLTELRAAAAGNDLDGFTLALADLVDANVVTMGREGDETVCFLGRVALSDRSLAVLDHALWALAASSAQDIANAVKRPRSEVERRRRELREQSQ